MQAICTPDTPPAHPVAPVDLEKRRLVRALLDLLVASDPYGINDPEMESARQEARVLLQRQLGG
jgi:hypothetical protein